jgi:hypothetical protein
LAEPDSATRQLELTVLDRWKTHDDVNRAWERIRQAATKGGKQPLSAEDFIAWVLEQAKINRRIVDDVIPESPDLERKMIANAEREWRKTRTGLGATAAGIKRDRAHQLRLDRTRILGRQPNPRKRFIRLCYELFTANCGQPLDQVTELLLLVVFGTPAGDNEVRDALKASTRDGRAQGSKNRR